MFLMIKNHVDFRSEAQALTMDRAKLKDYILVSSAHMQYVLIKLTDLPFVFPRVKSSCSSLKYIMECVDFLNVFLCVFLICLWT